MTTKIKTARIGTHTNRLVLCINSAFEKAVKGTQ